MHADVGRVLRTGDDAGIAPAGTGNAIVYVGGAPRIAREFAVGEATSAAFSLVVPSAIGVPTSPTGQGLVTLVRRLPVRSWFPLADLRHRPTGYGWMLVPVLGSVVIAGDASSVDETDEPRFAGPVWWPRLTPVSVAEPQAAPEGSAAARIRSLSGLEAERVAECLGVTRQAFYDWLAGAKPRGKRRDHLMQVLNVVEDAARRLGGPREVATWLVTPTGASNRVPFSLLKEHQYELCQSLLTRSPTRRLPQRRRRRLGADELREQVERITARPATEDYEGADE